MGRFFQSSAAGFVLGIILARVFQLNAGWVIPLVTLGTALLVWAIFLSAARKSMWFITLTACAILGAADATYFLDTRVEKHLDYVLENAETEFGMEIHGSVCGAPDIRDRYTIVPLGVYRIIDSKDITHVVNRGKLYVKVYASAGNASVDTGYGDHLILHNVRVKDPEPAKNPGGFDMRKFLRNQQYVGIVTIRNAEEIIVRKQNSGNPLMHAAQRVKDEFLLTIKETVPYPESSFLGGVLLGLRSGLSYETKDHFRAAGVSHVLAVSGLHVTIITLFFMGMFTLLRLPRTTAFICLISALVIFTLLTGARPSTMRAAIMNGVTLLFFYYQGLKLDKSFLLGISIAALVILTFNPLILGEASFLFSFTAVLSLALLTRPIWELACRYLRGFFRITLFLELLVATAICMVSPRLLIEKWEISVTGLIILAGALLADRIFPPLLEFRRLPLWFTMFAAAQMAIQLGMLPLTAFYFKKVSITAAAANFLAIPLIGIIVQLGLFAGILGQIPVIGPYLALCLNAANWLAIKLFMGSAIFFGTYFPYPDVPSPKPEIMVFYYAALLLLASRHWVLTQVLPRIRQILFLRKSKAIRMRLILSGFIGVILIANLVIGASLKPPVLKITVLDPSLYSMGGGNAVHIRTPETRHFLVDGGAYSTYIRNREVVIDAGSKVITPALLDLNSRHLSGVILTSARDDYAGGLGTIIGNPGFRIDSFYHALPFNSLTEDHSPEEIITLLRDSVLFQTNRKQRAMLTAGALKRLFAKVSDRGIPSVPVRDGSIIHREDLTISGKPVPFSMTVLNPPEDQYEGKYSTSSNSVVIRVEFGKVRYLLSSAIDRTIGNTLREGHDVSADILMLPANGADYAHNMDFINAVNPKIAVVSPLPSKWSRKSLDRIMYELSEAGITLFRTDIDGAVTVETNGENLRVHTETTHRTLELTGS